MISRRIQAYIKEKGFNQTAIGRKAGLTKMAMSSAMNGKRNLTAEEYVAICNALEVDLDFFTKQEEEAVK